MPRFLKCLFFLLITLTSVASATPARVTKRVKSNHTKTAMPWLIVDEEDVKRTLMDGVVLDHVRFIPLEPTPPKPMLAAPFESGTLALVTSPPSRATRTLCDAAAGIATTPEGRYRELAWEYLARSPACGSALDRLLSDVAAADPAGSGELAQALRTAVLGWSEEARVAHYPSLRKAAFEGSVAPITRLDFAIALGTSVGASPEKLLARLEREVDAALDDPDAARPRLVAVFVARAATGRLTSSLHPRLQVMRRRIGSEATGSLVALLATELRGSIAAWPFEAIDFAPPSVGWFDLLGT